MKKVINSVLLFFLTISLAQAETEINLVSETGDYIGQGETYQYTDEIVDITYSRNFDNGITVNIRNFPDDPYLYWTLNLAAPGDLEIQSGTYSGAERYPFQSAENPGLSFTGNGRGCNTVSGSFEVYEVGYDEDGNLTSLSATFEQYCGNSNSALRGEIVFNTVPPVGVSPIGISPYRVMCKNLTTGQKIVQDMAEGETFVDCKKLGLDIRPGDHLDIKIKGIVE